MTASRVSLGSTGTVFAHLLSPILAPFIKAFPRVQLDLVEMEDALLEDAVLKRRTRLRGHHGLGLNARSRGAPPNRGDLRGGPREPPACLPFCRCVA